MRLALRCLILTCMLPAFAFAQPGGEPADSLGRSSYPVYDYDNQQEFEIGGIRVVGAYTAEANAILGVTGLAVGQTIRVPGPDIPRAIRNLWRLRLFTDVAIEKERTIGNVIFLAVRVQEQPRLSRWSYRGVKQSTHSDLNEAVDPFLLRGGIVTENVKISAADAIRNYWIEKGFLDAIVRVEEESDTIRANNVRLIFNIDRREKVKIHRINFIGNEAVKASKLRKRMKETREKRKFLAASKFRPDLYETDKEAVLAYYNTLGYRDARITRDSVYRTDKGELVIDIYVDEGNQYYFRNIEWKGNSVYEDDVLSQVLRINAGDVYNPELLQNHCLGTMN
ncbi:MAG: POTRA domain-containing protein [Bacteroidota bacterium]